MIMVEDGDMYARLDDTGKRVVLVHYGTDTELSLSPLAAKNLGVVIPGLAQEAAQATLVAAIVDSATAPVRAGIFWAKPKAGE